MATLPDLDTTQIGVIAFWNAHDHRVDPASGATIDPTDVLGVLKSYTLYDNGVDGLIDYGPRTDINVRVKNDGWIIAWIDRTNQFFQNVNDSYPYKGYYDLLYNWKDVSNEISSNTNTLVEVINYLYNQFSNSADFSFVKSDVGVYSYEFQSSSTITLASTVKYGGTDYLKFFATSGTALYYVVATGAVLTGGTGNNYYVRYRDGTDIASGTSADPNRYGVLDLMNIILIDSEDYLIIYSSAAVSGWNSKGCVCSIWG